MKRDVFYAELRKRNSGIFGNSLSQRQVEGTEALLDAGQGMDAKQLSNVLAQCYWETGGGMYPVKETVFPHSKNKNPSDATVIARLNRAFAKGQLPWVKSDYWSGGFFGRGQIQVTHQANYKKCSAVTGVDLIRDPSKALFPSVSAKIAVEGMRAGVFTGKKLSDYKQPGGTRFDHYNARSIVNGDKNKSHNGRKVGEWIRVYANVFETALKEAGYSPDQVEPPREPSPSPQPPSKQGSPATVAVGGAVAVVGAAVANWWQEIQTWFAGLF